MSPTELYETRSQIERTCRCPAAAWPTVRTGVPTSGCGRPQEYRRDSTTPRIPKRSSATCPFIPRSKVSLCSPVSGLFRFPVSVAALYMALASDQRVTLLGLCSRLTDSREMGLPPLSQRGQSANRHMPFCSRNPDWPSKIKAFVPCLLQPCSI